MQVMSSGAAALQVLGKSGGQDRPQSDSTSTTILSLLATRKVAATPKLTGVYSDPRAEGAGPAPSSVAQRIIDSIQKTISTEFAQFELKAKRLLESALGRKLGDNERYYDLDPFEQANLPDDVRKMNMSVGDVQISLAMAASRPSLVDLDHVYTRQVKDGKNTLDSPAELRDLDISNVEDRSKIVEYAIKFQASMNMVGMRFAQKSEFASEMMKNSFERAGVERLDAENAEVIRESLEELHRTRFENGEFSVMFRGVEISSRYPEPAQS